MGRIRLDKCCCGLVRIETAAKIFAILAIIWSLLFIGLAFFHKHLYRWEPYVFGASGIFQLVAAILVLYACTKKRDDIMVLQLIIGFLILVALVIFSCMMVYGQFDRNSKLQTSVRKVVNNAGIGSGRGKFRSKNADDSREDEETTKRREKENAAELERMTKLISALVLIITLIVLAYNIWAFVTYVSAYIYFQELNADKPLKTVVVKEVISEKISNKFFPAFD